MSLRVGTKTYTFTHAQVSTTSGLAPNSYSFTVTATRYSDSGCTNTSLSPTTANATLVVAAAGATQLAFTTEPVGGVPEGTNFTTQPKVSVENGSGNVVTSDNGSVTIGIQSYTPGNGGTTQGTLTCANNTVNAVSGVATFSGCQISGAAAAGTYVLSATRTGLTSATSTNVTIAAGTVSQLAFVAQPSDTFAGNTMSPAVTVQMQDSKGNDVLTSGVTINLSLSSGSIASGASTTTDGSGLASFSSIVIDTPGIGLTMNATTTGASGTSSNFNVTVLVHNGATLTDAATDAGSGVASVSYYYCLSSNFTTLTCASSTPWTLIGTSTSTSPYSVTWSGQPTNGDYVVVAVGTDNVTNASGPSTSIPVTVNNLAPSVAITYPVTGTSYGANWSGTITGTATSNDGPGSSISSAAVQIEDTTNTTYWNGSSWQSGAVYNAASGGASWTYAFSSANLTTGHNYSVTAQATDNFANTGTSTAVTFSYKSTAPTVATVIGQASGASVNGFVKKGTGYYVYANVTDSSGTGIQSVTANVANVTSGDTAIALTAGSYTAPGGGSYNYRSALLSSNASQGDGAVSYTVNAKDNLNNTSTYSNNGSVTFDSTAPTGSVSVPTSANSASVSVTFSATDNSGGSGVNSAGGQLMRASATLSNGTCGSFGTYSSVGSAGVTSPSSDTTVTTGHCYEYEYVVSDNVGNQATVGPSGTVKVDTGSPTFVITASGSNVYTDGSANVWVKTGTTGSSFTLTATESVSGINASTVNFPTITGWTKGTVTTAATTASVTYTETASPGTGAKSASVASSAGNSTTLNYAITADTTAPSGGSVSYANGNNSTGSIPVSFTNGTDSGSGINTATTQLERAAATLTGTTCGTFGSFSAIGLAGQSSPYTDSTLVSGHCYEYEYVVSDNVGNTATYTSSNVVKEIVVTYSETDLKDGSCGSLSIGTCSISRQLHDDQRSNRACANQHRHFWVHLDSGSLVDFWYRSVHRIKDRRGAVSGNW